MTAPINPAGLQFPALPALQPAEQSSENAEATFQSLLLGAVEDTASAEASAQAAIQESIAGGDITQVEVFSAVKKADLALRMMLQIRNKLLSAYDEIKQMQV